MKDVSAFIFIVMVFFMFFLCASHIDSHDERIKALEKQLEKEEAPKPEPEKYREDCCAYYPD